MSTKNEYMLLFVSNEWYNQLPEAELKQVAAQAKAWLEDLITRGVAQPGNALVRSGVRVTGKTGRIITDGPYPESKEAVGGFVTLKADSLEKAAAIAQGNPMLQYGMTMEIRQIADVCPLDARLRELEQEPATAAA
ncbi:MAG TPA: YciI family protein [Verrucomicrobiae bacterium]|nr:YciI family protein [Verrucomicrobiae bacterium]